MVIKCFDINNKTFIQILVHKFKPEILPDEENKLINL